MPDKQTLDRLRHAFGVDENPDADISQAVKDRLDDYWGLMRMFRVSQSNVRDETLCAIIVNIPASERVTRAKPVLKTIVPTPPPSRKRGDIPATVGA